MISVFLHNPPGLFALGILFGALSVILHNAIFSAATRDQKAGPRAPHRATGAAPIHIPADCELIKRAGEGSHV